VENTAGKPLSQSCADGAAPIDQQTNAQPADVGLAVDNECVVKRPRELIDQWIDTAIELDRLRRSTPR